MTAPDEILYTGDEWLAALRPLDFKYVMGEPIFDIEFIDAAANAVGVQPDDPQRATAGDLDAEWRLTRMLNLANHMMARAF